MSFRDIQQDIQCRACMCKKIQFQKFCTIKDIEIGMKIHQIFMHLMPQLVIQEDDEFSQYICMACVIKLKNAYVFQEMCMESDRKYRETYFAMLNGLPANINEDVTQSSSQISISGPITTNANEPAIYKTLTYQLPKNTRIVSVPQNPTIIASKKVNLENESSDSTCERNICKEVAKNQKQVKTHICSQCNKALSSRAQLWRHERSHSISNSCVCPQCGKSFNKKGNLRQHMLRHSENKRYQCPHCPKKFPCISDIIKHRSAHSLKKNHICEICGSGFKRSYSLKAHLKKHSNAVERSYKCEQCGATFMKSEKLKQHIRIHTGEKPYPCQYCSRAFRQSGDLLKHLRLHLGEKIYDCTECKKKFKYQAELRVHQTECPPKHPPKQPPQEILFENIDIKVESLEIE